MTRSRALLLTGLLAVGLLVESCVSPGLPGTSVRMPALGDPSATVDGYLFTPRGPGRHPAIVFLHGCSGLYAQGRIKTRELDWATRFVAAGYVVLLVDSFSSRRVTEMCSREGFRSEVYLQIPKDAYAALRFLQAHPAVRPDRVALMGWSQGGGVTLFSIRADSLGRPPELPHGDFRAAVAFYPGSCRAGVHRLPWTSSIPLLVLVGAADNWTPAEPCRLMMEAAVRRGSDVTMQIYPGAYHDFDWPDLPLRTLPAYRTAAGVEPITAMDPAARADALERVPRFLARYLLDN